MKKFEKFLFAYSIIAVTFVFISSGLFSPTPQNFISAVLLLPLIAFFWIRITHPEQVSLPKWSGRILAVIVTLVALGLYASSIAGVLMSSSSRDEEIEKIKSDYEEQIGKLKDENDKLSVQASAYEDLTNQLADIKDEIKNLNLDNQNPGLSDLLMELDKPKSELPLGNVEVASELTNEVEVYDEPNFAGSLVGTINYGVSYPYYEVNGNWYKIKLPDETLGWVHERDVDVVEEN